MALIARLSLAGASETDPEDFFSSALGIIFPDDVMNQHGSADQGLVYTSPRLPKPLHITLADPTADKDRYLFSHYLWNSSLLLAELVEAGTLGLSATGEFASPVQQDQAAVAVDAAPNRDFDIAGLATIELGASTALPSIMAALLGARHVVVTDYPSDVVMKTLRQNVVANTQPSFSPSGRIVAVEEGVQVEGHEWGELDTPLAIGHRHAFDRVFVADCLWIPGKHRDLRRSIGWFMKADAAARAWVVGGFHTGRGSMCGFFDEGELAREGLEIERIWERDCDGVDRAWVTDRGVEDSTERKRWLAVAVLKRVAST
ncbi:hypothetical protein B0T18DRAFT_426662 [Schizothecium vesticola]|uniref:Nicotinamide N-methyltransferase n=1 Tax=Schizothecium vesticola TaxID=314040 RepID=A0AA40KAP6_9PEZI|nr:hypothetical protein B0T18DRAFT_426662 [Schizothecium vesticola]